MAVKAKSAKLQKSDDQIDLEAIGSKDEIAEHRTVDSRHRLRNQLAEDVEAFLSRGGSINEIAPDVSADPPKKPESNYGSRAI